MKILFVISIFNYHREVFPVVEFFQKQYTDVTVLIGWRGLNAEDASLQYQSLGCKIITIDSLLSYHEAVINKNIDGDKSSLVEKNEGNIFQIINKILGLQRLYSMISYIRYVLLFKKHIAEILKKLKFDAIFQGPFHSIGKIDNAVFWWAKQYNPTAKIYCYPVSAYHGKISAKKARIANVKAGMVNPIVIVNFDWINTLLSKLFPHLVIDSGSTKIFYSDPIQILLSRFFGLGLEDSWAKPQRNFDQYFVYSEFSKRLLDDGDFPMEKVNVVGIPLMDKAVEILNDKDNLRKLYSDLDLEIQEPFALVNIEPSWEHHYESEENHWKNFQNLMEAISYLPQKKILSLHPLCNPINYHFAESKWGVKISQNWKIHTLYPLCDFIISFPCSTNVIAEIFNKQLIIYDNYGLTLNSSNRQHEFKLPGAQIAYNSQELYDIFKGLNKTKFPSFDDSFLGDYQSASHLIYEFLTKENLTTT